jgi:hypothetical protein
MVLPLVVVVVAPEALVVREAQTLVAQADQEFNLLSLAQLLGMQVAAVALTAVRLVLEMLVVQVLAAKVEFYLEAMTYLALDLTEQMAQALVAVVHLIIALALLIGFKAEAAEKVL